MREKLKQPVSRRFTAVMMKPKLNVVAVIVCISALIEYFVYPTLFLPLIAIIQGLTISGGKGQSANPVFEMPLLSRIAAHPATLAALILIPVVLIFITAIGVGREKEKRGWWVFLLIISVLLFMGAAAFGAMIHMFTQFYRDLGMK
jgi:hypothetical protein